MRARFAVTIVIIVAAGVTGCGKEPARNKAATADPCTKAKATPPFQTQEQAAEECRNRHNMSGQPDPKASNTPISNN
jgi:hypothetical protein